jgi:hypothetical protein
MIRGAENLIILPLVHNDTQGVEQAADKHRHPVRTLKGQVNFSSVRFGREPLDVPPPH